MSATHPRVISQTKNNTNLSINCMWNDLWTINNALHLYCQKKIISRKKFYQEHFNMINHNYTFWNTCNMNSLNGYLWTGCRVSEFLGTFILYRVKTRFILAYRGLLHVYKCLNHLFWIARVINMLKFTYSWTRGRFLRWKIPFIITIRYNKLGTACN